MPKTLRITLPVMLHSDAEVPVFLAAKKRLEGLGQQYGVPIQVGAFLPYMSGHARKPTNFVNQVRNQDKYRLPIWLAETGIEGPNSLVYVPENTIYNPVQPADHERILEQVAKLRALDPEPIGKLVVGPHIAAQFARSQDIKPGSVAVYTLEQFAEQRDALYGMAKERFAKLSKSAGDLGLTLATEIAPLATYEDHGFWEGSASDGERRRVTAMRYHAFNDLASLLDISEGRIVLDTTHLAGTLDASNSFTRNREDTTNLFLTAGVSSWDEFRSKTKSFADYLPHAHALHISGAEGIGVRLNRETGAEKWGGAGMLPSLITNRQYADLLHHAIAKDLPVAVEEDFITPEKPKERLDFIEADEFLKPIFAQMQRMSS
ncbi:MAG: hypothetical protein AABX10_05235 [Nanoarchaeota archaeon]